jgi:6-pyruvoyl-tetrahydropterin synthase
MSSQETLIDSTPVNMIFKGQPALFWEELMLVDYAYLDHDGRAWGHSFRLQAILSAASLDHEFVVADFSHMKNFLKEIAEQQIDHVLWVDENQWTTTQHSGHCELKTPFLTYRAPQQAFFLFKNDVFGKLNVLINEVLEKQFPNRGFQVQFQASPNPDVSYFQYTHGLKKHYGNCQRLLHGHLSPLHQPMMEASPAALLFLKNYLHGKHLVWKENIKSESATHLIEGYQANQGAFELEIDKRLCLVLEDETTIENMALFAKALLNQHFPALSGTFYLREGLTKGALISF